MSNAEDRELWTTAMTEGGERFPFVEDEDANITGLGWQDKAEFAAAINRYDAECGVDLAEDDQWQAEHISHQLVTRDPDGERLHAVAPGTSAWPSPATVAVTTLWGAR